MCGFLLCFDKSKINNQIELNQLLKKSIARGPDKTLAVQPTPNVWMGFNRLAIQDLSAAGDQPMTSDDGKYCMVFNGEIYNHLELRKRLNFTGWKGHSDTETVIQAVCEWGFDRTIEALDGMFAIACYSIERDELYCARDFAGIKPFFYGWDGTTFVGASQYNQITGHSGFRNKSIDQQVLRLYLEQHFMPAPFGLYQDTGQLEPGEMLTIKNQRINKRKYWEFPEYAEPTVFDTQSAVKIINDALGKAVRDELIGDVPLGSFLSGGIDSPLISYYGKQLVGGLKTFTIGSDSKVHDESEDAATYSRLIGTDHQLEKLDAAKIKAEIPEILKCITEPMADFSVIPTWLLSRLAKKQVSIALSGDGGDELFFGYERFWSVAKNIHFQDLPYIVRAGIYGANKYLFRTRKVNSVLLALSQSKAHQGLHSRFTHADLENLFPHLKGVKLPESFQTYGYTNTRDERLLIQAMRRAEFYGMMQKTLRKVDLASMDNSLEVRLPFLKKSLIETSLKIDPMLSYGSAKKKQILKLLLWNKIPSAPINDKKRGFSVPLGQWMREPGFFEYCIGQRREILVERWGMDDLKFEIMKKQHALYNKDHKWPLFTLMALGSFDETKN